MTQRPFAIIDPSAGISGDMLLGALVSALGDSVWLEALPARLGLDDTHVRVSQVERCGVSAVKVDVVGPGGQIETPADAEAAPHEHEDHHHAHSHDEPHGHSHPHHHVHSRDVHRHGTPESESGGPTIGHDHHAHGAGTHRHVGELVALIERAPLSNWVRERAVRAFRLLGEAEGAVHGLAAEDVPLHEVGAVDAVVDIVGAIAGFERLGVTAIYHRPVSVGRGWVRAAHGLLSVPTPATALLLEGVEIVTDGPAVGEATTPTGAVLLRVLSSGPPPTRWRLVEGRAWGAGTRNPATYPNALRLIIAEASGEAEDVVMLATDIDDLAPEYLDPLREALTAAGALDVQVWATQMKKGRTGFRVEALASAESVESVTDAFFRHSTTAGVRRWRAGRVTLPRREILVDVDGAKSVRVKVLDGPGGVRFKPEYDDVAELARRTGRPAHEVAGDLREQAARSIAGQEPLGQQTTNKE